MKLLVITIAVIFSVFSLMAALNGSVALGLPVLVLASCTLGALLAGAEGIGLALVLLSIGLGWQVSWWICPFVAMPGICLIALDAAPTTPIGQLFSDLEFSGWFDGGDAGGGDGGG